MEKINEVLSKYDIGTIEINVRIFHTHIQLKNLYVKIHIAHRMQVGLINIEWVVLKNNEKEKFGI